MAASVSVVAAIITPSQSDPVATDQPLNPDVRVLLSQRRPGKHLAGHWEFPGGRIEPGETTHTALARELKEELGVLIEASRPWCSLTHHYPDKTVHLHIHRVTQFQGVPAGCEGQLIEWVRWGEVAQRPMPAADRALLKVFGMAPVAWIAPSKPHPNETGDAAPDALSRWRQGLAGIKNTPWAGDPWWLVWPLGPQGASDEAWALARQAMALAKEAGHRPLLAGSAEKAQALGASGVYLDQAAALALTERPVGLEWVAVACHDAQGLAQATALDADFATLSPLRRAQATPDQHGLGGEQFKALMAQAGLPVLALGGVGCEDVAWARSLGAFGVAGVHSLWR
jgi:8-oxo-dGTP diphosphatase